MKLKDAMKAIREKDFPVIEEPEAVKSVIEAIKAGYVICPDEDPKPEKNVDAEALKKLAAAFRANGDTQKEGVLIQAAAAIVDFEAKYHAARKNLINMLKGESL